MIRSLELFNIQRSVHYTIGFPIFRLASINLEFRVALADPIDIRTLVLLA